MFKFTDKFKTGLELMDRDHERLFQLTDEAYTLLTDEFITDKYDYIIHLLNELRDYAKTHFKNEEEYMMKNGYKSLFSHKIAHNNFIEKLDTYDFEDIDENQKEAILDILNFLYNWLEDHILRVDKEVVRSLKEDN